MDVPYSSKYVQWATFIIPSFFTLPTNKSKSDRVTANFWSPDGTSYSLQITRGRYTPQAKEKGILTPLHGRILAALENIWVQQGCRCYRYRNGGVRCYLDVSIRELARILNWKQFNAQYITCLINKITELKEVPYYLDFSSVDEFCRLGLKGYGFTFVDGAHLIDKTVNGQKVTTMAVHFSDFYSRQLISRRVVSRPMDFVTMTNDLAFLIRLYIEPILQSRSTRDEHKIYLKRLIENLNLPPADWHRAKSHRKRVFARAIKDLNGRRTIHAESGPAGTIVYQEREFLVTLEQGLTEDDFMLVSRLIVPDHLSGTVAQRVRVRGNPPLLPPANPAGRRDEPPLLTEPALEAAAGPSSADKKLYALFMESYKGKNRLYVTGCCLKSQGRGAVALYTTDNPYTAPKIAEAREDIEMTLRKIHPGFKKLLIVPVSLPRHAG